MPNILDLPTELVVHILGQVEYKSLIACRQACKKLRAIISRTPLLLYHLDLGGVGMCDDPSSVQPLHERRSKLLAYEEAWRSLDFSIGYLTVRVPPEAGWYIDQTLLRIITDHRSEADPILLEHKSTMIRVRAPLRGVAHSRWELSHGDGVELPSIRIDSSQDLLLQARGDDSGDLRVYAVNILTSTPHSEARVPFAILAGRIDGRLETINGDRFMIRMQSPSNSTSYVYEIWNWQDGSFVARLPSGVTDYSFLDSNHVLAYRRLKNPSTLIVVKLAPSHDDTCSTVAEFQLPEFDWLLGPGSNAAISCCSSAPSSGCVAIGDFYTEPDGTLVSLIIWDLSEDESEKCFQLLVPSTALLSYVSAPGLASDLPKIVPWHDWGVQHANIFQTTDILLLASSSMPMSGLRALPYDHPVRGTIHGHDVWMMEVRDFHPHRVARARAVSKRVPVHMRNWDVHECSIVDGRFMADGNPLVAGAPYISTRKELPSEALAGVVDPESVKLTIAEDCIVAYRTVEDDAEDGFGFTDVFIWSF